jgi:N-acetyl sugar amidotransferase
MEKIKTCSKCLMPETAETLVFDKDKTCSVCNQIKFKKKINWNNRDKDFDNLLEKYRGAYEYDCLVPFSGGKDSTFTLWYLVKVKKLKVLAVRFNHNFLRDQVLHNTEKALKKLGVSIYEYKPRFNIVKEMMVESLKRRGDFCWHCHVGISAFPINTAIEKKIPLIIYGEPSSEYSSYYDYSEAEELNEEKFNKFVNLGINIEDMVGMINEKRDKDKQISLSELKPFIFPTKRELILNKIKACYLGNYLPWDVKKQVEIIKKELDWRGEVVEGIPERYNYEKIECIMQGTRDYIKFLKRGFGRTNHLASIDIRNGRLSRDEGADLVKIYDGKRPKSLELLLKILNISEDEFYDIVNKHVIEPHKIMPREDFKKSSTNIIPKDLDDWLDKFK